MVRISVELPDEVAERLQFIAREQATTPEALAAEAILGAVAADAALDSAIAEAEAEIAAGDEIPHDEVMRDLRGWAAALRARHGGP